MISWRQRVRDLEAENEYLREKISELEHRLLMYENAHTPSSKSKKIRPKKPTSGKLGAKKGHPKWERKEPESTGSIEYQEGVCPDCQTKLNKPYKSERVIEEEIPEPQPIEVIEHIINHYQCYNCRKHIVAKNSAPKGRFGKNLETHVTLLKYEDRLPLRKVVNALQRHYGITITNTGVLNITKRVAKTLRKPYEQIIRRIREADVVYGDETEIKVNGVTYHLWTFVTEYDVVFIIRKSRGSDVIEEILGKNYRGTICCDGWTAYKTYSNNLQRCWAHLLREFEEISFKYPEAKGFYDTIKAIFKQIKKIRDKAPPIEVREKWREKLKTKLEQLVETMNAYTQLRKFANKILNGIEHWFTCVVNLDVEPTNNTAERALRELIIQRKIIGGLRREKGAFIMETIYSVIASLKMKNLNAFHSIKAII